jgi:hypothetical protein
MQANTSFRVDLRYSSPAITPSELAEAMADLEIEILLNNASPEAISTLCRLEAIAAVQRGQVL